MSRDPDNRETLRVQPGLVEGRSQSLAHQHSCSPRPGCAEGRRGSKQHAVLLLTTGGRPARQQVSVAGRGSPRSPPQCAAWPGQVMAQKRVTDGSWDIWG